MKERMFAFCRLLFPNQFTLNCCLFVFIHLYNESISIFAKYNLTILVQRVLFDSVDAIGSSFSLAQFAWKSYVTAITFTLLRIECTNG